jgi:periplasmic protein TonB
MNADMRPALSRRDDPVATRGSRLTRGLRFLVIATIHVAILVGATFVVRPELATDVEHIYVRMIEAAPRVDAPPAVEEARPLPMAKPKVEKREVVPQPVLAAAADDASTSFAVAPPPPAPDVSTPSAPPAVTEASFDADYLHNPKPEYPWAARRRGDQGKVMLRVRVSAQGTALAVEIGQSSGSSALDEAARDAVLRWRFVPARRGSEAIESWVGVPIVFRLDR